MKAIAFLTILIVACTSPGTGAFGHACNTGGDCASDFCVGGEVGGTAFCSEDCTGKPSGAACGGGAGRCVADFVAWCWLPCTTDADCTAVNAARPVCRTGSSGGKAFPFATCFSAVAPAGDATDTTDAATPIGDAAAASGDAAVTLDEAASETSSGTAAIGSPCKTAADCADGTCLTGNLWVKGYCAKTIAECPAPGSKVDVCPTGAACVAAILSGAGESEHTGDYCMKVCALPGDCRQGDGYQCCTTGQFQGKDWCGVGCQ